MRSAGILMPITSLPSNWGVGTFGQSARDFIDFLHRAGQSYWQILPIGPTSYGDSPYQSFSSYAGNPYLIDLDDLTEAGLLNKHDYSHIDWYSDMHKVDYGKLYKNRFQVLRIAASKLMTGDTADFDKFCLEQQFWLDNYALFMSLKEKYEGMSWMQWPDDIRLRKPQAINQAVTELHEEIRFWQAVQFLFYCQWRRLKKLACTKGIEIIGDLPIYVAADSADVWAEPEQFQLNDNLQLIEVAGCPPDGFSADGQLWGNPLFNWDKMREESYSWWIRRISYQFQIYDILRIDHFRGFDAYYSIPAEHKTARDGVWKLGPGVEFFHTLESIIGKKRIIAEDLGFLTPSVHKLLEDTGFPGMKVLEFAFDSRDTGSGYLPHTYPRNCVVYTGTHDNDTINGWMNSAPADDVSYAKHYLRLNEAEGYNWGMMRSAWASVADLAIIQFQDLLGIGSEGRINIPSTVGGNWVWRCDRRDFNDELANRLRSEMALYQRSNANKRT